MSSFPGVSSNPLARDHMRTLLLAGALVTIVACNNKDDNHREPGMSADTTVVERTVPDTMIVTRDTIVRVDTTRRRGTRATDMDTTRKP